jgi:predicted  nucleic acid-binding Zn-ribbon protein
VTTGCHDATIVITVPGHDPDMTEGPASSQHLRAFLQLPEHLLEGVNRRFGEQNVAAMLRLLAQTWIATFGVVNRERFLAGARENGSPSRSNPNAAPFKADTQDLPPLQPDSAYRVINGIYNDHGNDLTPFVHGQDYVALVAARSQLLQDLTAVHKTLHATRNEVEGLSVQLREAEDEAGACHAKISSLVGDKTKLTEAADALRLELAAIHTERDSAQQSLAELTAQFNTLTLSYTTLHEQNKFMAQQLESLANCATEFHRETSAVIEHLQEKIQSLHECGTNLSSEVSYCQGEIYELVSEESSEATEDSEDEPGYVPTPIPAIPTPNVDVTSVSIVGGALLQLARRVRSQAAAKTIRQADLDEHFERGVPWKAVESPLPALVAEVLAAHKQPDFVAAVINSTLSLPHASYKDMYTLLRIETGSCLERDLTVALKQVLGIDFLP